MESAVSRSTDGGRGGDRCRVAGARVARLARGDGGFSLIEAIVAAGLLSVVMLGFAMGASRALRYNQYSRSVAVATTLAHDKIEELQSREVTDPQLVAGSYNDANNPLTAIVDGIHTGQHLQHPILRLPAVAHFDGRFRQQAQHGQAVAGHFE